jgi:CheY-like chemotaxis protein
VTMLQQERLRALGQMASGIAHDINNAVSPISLYTESLLEREPNLSERARSYLTTIQRAIDDVARTVSRMREFYRDRETQLTLQKVDLNKAVEQVVDLTRPRWSNQPQQGGIAIELRTELAAELPEIMGADNEIRDALTNLVFNAVDAMPSGGTLTLRTRSQMGEAGVPSIVVEVGDTGIGMDEETRRRCLEPFFTTKGERGTGLGLAMVYGMVQRHSAGLEIDSAPGQGTTMRLVFVAASASSLTGQFAAPVLPSRSLRVLLVDDDPMLLSSLQDILREDGHVVVPTNGGQVGINAFTTACERGEPFDLVITDLGMPYVDGRKVAAAVKTLAPATPVILLTGWGQRFIAARETPPHVDRVLSKPPKLSELRATFVELTT